MCEMLDPRAFIRRIARTRAFVILADGLLSPRRVRCGIVLDPCFSPLAIRSGQAIETCVPWRMVSLMF